MPLPDFIIIGAMKSGTSTLHSNLQLHPEIGMSKFKEPHYFDRNFEKPLEWYKNQFRDNKRIHGESTPAYTWAHFHPEVAERIYKTLPNAKLIYVVRDPIDRIISNLHHNLYRDRLKLESVDKVVLEDPQYLQTSKYFYQVRHYLKFFDKESILFVETNDLQSKLNGTLNEICQFLGVENFDFAENAKVRNQSARKYLIKHYDVAHKYLPRIGTKLYHTFFYFVNKKIARPRLKEETLRELKKKLFPDIEELKRLTGKDFRGWKTFNSVQPKTGDD